MKRLFIAAIVVLVGIGIGASSTAAQELAEGTWTGSVMEPDGEGFDVTYEVAYEDGALTIAIVPPARSGAD